MTVEEPLEIRLIYGPEDQREERSLAITMRTPGQDEDLVRGFLFSEGIVSDPSRIRSIEPVSKRAEGIPSRWTSPLLYPSIGACWNDISI